MQKAPELAVFLKNVELVREALAKRITLVFSTSMPGMELFSLGAMNSQKKAGVPGVTGLMNATAHPKAEGEQNPAEVEAGTVKTGASR